MHIYNKNKIFKTLLTLIMTGIFLVACDEQKKKAPVFKIPVQKYKQITVLTGSVQNEKGSVLEGEIKVVDSSGRVVATTRLENSKNYRVEIPAGTILPIVLTATAKSSNEKLKAVVITPAGSRYDISPLTTKIAKRAKELGGYTYNNLAMAAGNTVGVPDANKTSTGFRGDPTKQYGGWH